MALPLQIKTAPLRRQVVVREIVEHIVGSVTSYRHRTVDSALCLQRAIDDDVRLVMQIERRAIGQGQYCTFGYHQAIEDLYLACHIPHLIGCYHIALQFPDLFAHGIEHDGCCLPIAQDIDIISMVLYALAFRQECCLDKHEQRVARSNAQQVAIGERRAVHAIDIHAEA